MKFNRRRQPKIRQLQINLTKLPERTNTQKLFYLLKRKKTEKIKKRSILDDSLERVKC